MIDDAIEQHKVNYFELKSLLQTALHLHPLVRGPNSVMSILTGTSCVYQQRSLIVTMNVLT